MVSSYVHNESKQKENNGEWAIGVFFMVATPTLWNRLPLSIRLLKIIESFKCAVDIFLLREVYAV